MPLSSLCASFRTPQRSLSCLSVIRPAKSARALILIFPTLYATTGGLLLQWYLGYNFSVAVWVGYIALFGIAVETGVVMVVYLHEALDQKLAAHATMIRGADDETEPNPLLRGSPLLPWQPVRW
jgi:copper/silver efflux system protein